MGFRKCKTNIPEGSEFVSATAKLSVEISTPPIGNCFLGSGSSTSTAPRTVMGFWMPQRITDSTVAPSRMVTISAIQTSILCARVMRSELGSYLDILFALERYQRTATAQVSLASLDREVLK